MFGLKVFTTALAVLTISACKDENNQAAVPSSAPVVEAIKVEPHNVQLSFEYAARVQGSKETEVRARVGGILLKRNYVEGSKVKEGDVLFQIDPEPFEVELLQAKAELSQNQANLKAAETQWERVSKLFKERIVSEKSRDEALANLDSLKATTALAEAKVKSAQLNLNYTTVRAPISGMTSMETQSEGSLIAVNTPMTTITQFDPAYVIFSASENEIFKLGTMVEQGLIVNPRHSKTVYAKVKYGNGNIYGYDGEINFVNPSIDETTGTLKLRAVFPNPRNLTDEQFTAIIEHGGVAGLNLYAEFVGGKADLEAIAAHLDHWLELGGEKNIALGGDLDGCSPLAGSMAGVQDYERLYHFLLERGYGLALVQDLFFNNLMRVVSKVCTM